jgi:hypothetical protein
VLSFGCSGDPALSCGTCVWVKPTTVKAEIGGIHPGSPGSL